MKLLILLFTAWLASQGACAQQIRLSLNNAPFRQLLKSIEQQSDYSFIYTKSQLDGLPAVTLTVNNKDLFQLLNEQLKKQPIGYTVDDHFIILYTKQQVALDTLRNVSGRVSNEAGEAIAGATVQIRNEPAIAITDKQGHFSLQYLSHNALLQISGAELITTLVTINDRNYIEVHMNEQVKELDETIIMAYGKTTKRFNTGNISKISADELENQPTGNLLSALQGRVPGLLITATSGAPGASFIAQVRGQNSVNPNPLINNGVAPLDNPLIIVNGVPFAPQNNNINQLPSLASPGNLEVYRNPHGGISPFSSIDPADIESVEVLKDADMTAIYGSRAANGIILITTRQPKPGKINLQLDISTGINTAASKPSMLNTSEYLDMRRRAFAMDSIQPGADPSQMNYAPDLLVFDSTKYTDWRKYFFNAAAPFTSVHTRVSGGSKRLNFISGMGYRGEANLLKGDFYNKLLSLNNSVAYHSINGRLELEGSLYYTQGVNRSVSSPLLLQAINLPPNYPDLLNESGELNWQYKNYELEDNPAALVKQPYAIRTWNFITYFRLNYQISRGLHLWLNTGYNNYQTNETSVFAASTTRPSLGKRSYAYFAKENLQTMLTEPQLEFKKKFDKTTITMLSGITIQINTLSLLNSKGSEYQTDEYLGSIDEAGKIESRKATDRYHYQSFFGRIGLLQAGKYILNLTGRRERSNRLSSEREWGNFASLAGGWIFSEEKFFKQSIPFINFGKLRLSYGGSGNDNTGYYHQLNAWAAIPTYTGGQPLIPLALADANFGWSTTKKTEAGLELRLLQNKISIDISTYLHQSANQLISQLSSSQVGTSRYISNFPAVVQNKGWEIIIGSTITPLKSVQWNTSFNINFPQNKLKNFPGIENGLYASHYFPGHSLGTMKLIRFTGVNQETGLYTFDPAAYVFKDNYPWLYGGLRNSISYKKLEVAMFIEFRKQNGVNYLQQTNSHIPGIFNQPRDILNHWQYPGDRKTWQRLTIGGSAAHIAALTLTQSDASYSDASYIRFKNLLISYSLEERKVKRIGLNSVKIYLQAQNIFTATSFKQTDPEVQSFYSYPLQRSFSIGLLMQL
jgi:TonB-linked SusC/RagA family outer membrane protein